MMPGIGGKVNIDDLNIDDNATKHIEAIIQSMTKKERQNPDILNGPRKRRIAKGSGTSIQEINKLLKQFEEMKNMMKMMNGMAKGKKGFGGLGGLGGGKFKLPF